MENTIKNDLTQRFSRGTITIHWLSAILIITLFPMGKYMTDLDSADKLDLIKVHALLGIIVFLLTLIRSWLFFKSSRPADLKTGSKFNDRLAVWIHNAFYFLLIGISISGIGAMVLGGYIDALTSGSAGSIINRDEILPLKGHNILSIILMVLLIMHVLGVIKHYLVTRENTLKRIFY